MKCPICHADTPGAYCPACGAPVQGAACKSCEAPLLAGARFCTRCGDPVRRSAAGIPWFVAGASLIALIVVLAIPAFRGGSAGARMAPDGTGAVAADPSGWAPGAPGPLTGTPREQADRLFNRVMQAIAQGDSVQASFFLPMAVLAYRQAGELDADGLYHLAVLEVESGDATAARATADRILDAEPDHLLALGVAARAADLAGDRAAARRYYERLLQVYDAERSRDRVEYRDHAPILPEYRSAAEAYLGRQAASPR